MADGKLPKNIAPIVRDMRQQIARGIEHNEDADAASWSYQEGVLLSRREAEQLIAYIKGERPSHD